MIAVLAAVTGCAGPYQYDDGTGVHDAVAAEVAGTWVNIDGTRVVLHANGTAQVENLDGQDFDFDDGWRLSGRGRWQLSDRDGGQLVRLELTGRTHADRRPGADATATAAAAGEAPSTYAWSMYVDRRKGGEVTLFFFFGDPDAGNAYVLMRTSAVP
nr:hypothetical protein [Actinospica acidiphila]